jgi:hypothetical protein
MLIFQGLKIETFTWLAVAHIHDCKLLFSIGSIKGLTWFQEFKCFSFRVWWKTLLKEIWIVHLVKRHLQITFPRSMVPSNVLNVSFLFLVFLINEFCSLFSVIYMPIKSETHSELFYILYCFRTIIVYIT